MSINLLDLKIHTFQTKFTSKKAHYATTSAFKTWYETLLTYLLDNGFHRGQIDKTLFIRRHKDDILLVQVYVDDIIFGSTKKEMSIEFEKLMHDKFQMSSMGELSFFLGLQVKQKSDGIFISQDKYVAEILKKFDFASVKTASTLMETNKPLIKDEEAEDVDVHLYRSMIGSLMYLTASRPDIMFAVCACARFQVLQRIHTFMIVKRKFRYLKGKPKLGLWYPRDSPFDLEAFSDSDYAGASLDKKSTTRGCQFLGKRLISWQCKKQTIVANSTTEAEYVATANCCGHVGDEAIHKELGDRIERDATTASSSEAEQDSGSGPRCQDTILGDVDAQTRLILVLDLEKAKSDQAIEIASLKKRVDKLEKMRQLRTIRLKRFKKLGTAKRVKSSNASLGAQEDASKQGRSIEDIDEDDVVTLVNETQEQQNEDLIFDTGVLDDDEVFVNVTTSKKDEQSIKLDDSTTGEAVTTSSVEDSVAPTIQVSTADIGGVTATKIDELTLAQTLIEIKAAKPKVVTITATTTTTTRPKAKGLARKQEEEANIALIESWEYTQAMMEVDRLLAERIQSKEREELTDEEKGKLFMELMEKRRKHFAALRAQEKRKQNEDLMFDTGVLDDDEVFVDVTTSEKDEQSTKLDDSTAGEAVTTASVEDSAAPTIQVSTADIGGVTAEPSEFRDPQETQPSISKDKGKGIMIEPKVPLKRKDQIALDEQIGRDIQAKLDAKLIEEQKLARKQEEANISLIESWENTQAMMEADRLLAERLQSKEREELTDEEKGKLFMELMEKRRKHFAALRAQEKRNRPPTKAQKRTQMSTYLNHMGGYTYKQLKGKSFDEIQKLFDK
ncbi:putative ribonuclease H-like domain-containing protein [Tanacetum coccineum]